MFWDMDLLNATIVFDDISWLADDLNLKKDIDFLKEDMLQITFGDNYLLDVGWRPSFSKSGQFYLTVVKNSNWDEVLEEIATKSVPDLKDSILKYVQKYV